MTKVTKTVSKTTTKTAPKTSPKAKPKVKAKTKAKRFATRTFGALKAAGKSLTSKTVLGAIILALGIFLAADWAFSKYYPISPMIVTVATPRHQPQVIAPEAQRQLRAEVDGLKAELGGVKAVQEAKKEPVQVNVALDRGTITAVVNDVARDAVEKVLAEKPNLPAPVTPTPVTATPVVTSPAPVVAPAPPIAELPKIRIEAPAEQLVSILPSADLAAISPGMSQITSSDNYPDPTPVRGFTDSFKH